MTAKRLLESDALVEPVKQTAMAIVTAWMPEVNQCGALVGRYRTGQYKTGKYGSPGGGIEKGETPEEAAEREIYEETGCRVKVLKTIEPYVVPLEIPKTIEILYFMAEWAPKKAPKGWNLPPTREMDALGFYTVDTIRQAFLGRMFDTERAVWWEYAFPHIEKMTAMRRMVMEMD